MRWVDYLGRAALVGDAYRGDDGLSVDVLLPFDGERYRRAAAPLVAEEHAQSADDPAAEARMRAKAQAALAGVLPAGRMALAPENAPEDARAGGRGGIFVPGLFEDGPAGPYRAKYGAQVSSAFLYETLTIRGPWPAGRPLRLALYQGDRWLPVLLPFTVDGKGAEVPFTHPETGARHVLKADPLEFAGPLTGPLAGVLVPVSAYEVQPPLPAGQRLDICADGEAPSVMPGAFGVAYRDHRTRMVGRPLAPDGPRPAQYAFFLAGICLPDGPRTLCTVPVPPEP